VLFLKPIAIADQLLAVEHLAKSLPDGTLLFNDITFSLTKGDKVVVLSKEHIGITTFFEILMGNDTPDAGEYTWGSTITRSYLPNENAKYFSGADNLVDWLRQYSTDKDETYIRGFLGRMLFSGDEVFKKSNVLSGGEKVRCMLSRMMLTNANCLILDEPTNHLDLESITSINNALKDWKHLALFTSHDHEFVQTVANRVIEITPSGIIDKRMTYDEYIADEAIKTLRESMYTEAVLVK